MKIYNCFTCGPLEGVESHDGRDGTDCVACVVEGECINSYPAVRIEGYGCYWKGLNGHMAQWYVPDPEHSEKEGGLCPVR